MRYLRLLIILISFNSVNAEISLPDMSNAEAVQMFKVCNNDILNKCDGVEPGNNRIIFCLMKRTDLLENPCKALVKDYIEEWGNSPN